MTSPRTVRALILALSLAGWTDGALAQTATPTNTPTETPTATPTNTPTSTPIAVNTPTPVATLTPRPGTYNGELPPGTHALGDVLLDRGDLLVQAGGDGGDRGATNKVIAPLSCDFAAFGTMTNGSTESTRYIDDTPTGEWATERAAGATLSADTGTYKIGSTSLKIAFTAAATTGDGAVNDISNDDLEADEHIGFWIYATEQLSGGDLRYVIEDTDSMSYYLIPAVPQRRWTWVDIDISGLTGGTGNVTNKVHVQLTAQGATNHGAFGVHLDGMYKWDGADEEAIGYDVVDDGFDTAMAIPTAGGSPVALARYTDYIIAFRTGNDSIVTLTNQSSNSGWAFACHK